ncbi:MAG: hypothetical protein IT488_03155 [Gammaproteobacteria bacterium]|nr:hypothetical protein [Gammaproteobacteria bacterium]
MKPARISSSILHGSLLIALGALSACGGDGSDESTTAINGSVFASSVDGATVTVEDLSGNTVAGPVTTDNSGGFTIEIPDDLLADDLVFRSSGGSFADEASGDTGVAGGNMGAYVAGGALGTDAEVHLTPTSTIVQNLVTEHGSSLADAEALVATSFGEATGLDVAPLDTTQTPDAGADQEGLRAGLRAAAFSQLALDLGLEPEEQFDLLAALAADLTDDALDGEDASGAVPVGAQTLPGDVQNRFERALMNFRDSGNDNSGLTADQIGDLAFAKVTLTDSYRIEYVPGASTASDGKTTFSLNITDRDSGAGVNGLTITLSPVMYMSGMSHGTAVDGCVAGMTAGAYDCTVYYLMASSMANGMSMGYWDLGISVDGGTPETAHLYPHVMMAMGDTTRSVLRGQADVVATMGMGMAQGRNYYVFLDTVEAAMGGGHDIALFIAARETMMSHPPVSVGTVLNDGTMYELNVTTMTVELATDATNWTAATDNGEGHWSAAGVAGLTEDEQGELYVRLTINGEQKTTDAATPAGDGSNDYGTFLVTPGGAPMMM